MAGEVDESFGDLLRRYRGAAGLSQEALAARSGVSVDAVGMLERGLRSRPRHSTVLRLADALRLRPPEREALTAAARQLAGSPPRPRSPAARLEAVVPRELPRPPADFTGRRDELSVLLGALTAAPAAGSPRGAPLAITTIDGMGGVGKSALAIHAAHRLAGAFPDGQLYVDLRGATAGLAPLEPLEVLGRMLRSLGADPGAIPGRVDEAAARFRSLAAGRRLLVLLDNARSAEQVRPLLPGSPTSAVVVTSRQALATLEGGRALHVDVLAQDVALELLGRIAGPERIAAETGAAIEVVRLCGGLPLAIRIAGARLLARPSWPVRELAEQLSDTANRLERLQADEVALRACFDVSLHALHDSPDAGDRAAAAAFELLSLPDGPDLGVASGARLLDRPEADARALMERLVDARLLESPRPARYRFHDLVRLYARAGAARRPGEPERVAALVRLLGFYLATAWRATALLRPDSRRLAGADSRWTAGGDELPDAPGALSWLEAERANLLAAIEQAARLAAADAPGVPHELPGQLVQALYAFFEARSYWHDAARANETALEIARRAGDETERAGVHNHLGSVYLRQGRFADALDCLHEGLALGRQLDDRWAQAEALCLLGIAYIWLGRHDEAVESLQASVAGYQEVGDRAQRALALGNLGIVYGRLGRHEDAIACTCEALRIATEVGFRQGQASFLNNLGTTYRRLGRYGEAIASLRDSVAIFQELGNRKGQGDGIAELGIALGLMGFPDQAIACQRECLSLFRELGDRRGQALALRDLGDALRSAGRDREAREAWLEGVAIAEALCVPETEEIRARLLSRRPALASGPAT